MQILVVYAKSKRGIGRPEQKNKDKMDLKKTRRNGLKKDPVKSKENNQDHIVPVKKVIGRSLINDEKIMDVKQLE